MNSTFERIAEAFKENNFGLTRNDHETPLNNPTGDQGSRSFQFTIEGVEHGDIDASWIAGRLQSQFGVACSVTFEIKSSYADDNYVSFLIVSNDPLDPWGLHVDGSVPHDEDFPASVDFSLMESDADIQMCIHKENKQEMEGSVLDTIAIVEGYTRGDEKKAIAFLDELIERDPAFLKVWMAHFNAKALGNTTPEVSASRPSKRM